MQNFRDALKQRVILFDGAMGTEIYKRGVYINRSYDEVNLTAPDLVGDIHERKKRLLERRKNWNKAGYSYN